MASLHLAQPVAHSQYTQQEPESLLWLPEIMTQLRARITKYNQNN